MNNSLSEKFNCIIAKLTVLDENGKLITLYEDEETMKKWKASPYHYHKNSITGEYERVKLEEKNDRFPLG